MTTALTDSQANAVWDVLVLHAGAHEDRRESFIFTQTDSFYPEYRFRGALGFGGKFWRDAGRWYVTCYPEDMTPERQAIVDATNEALAAALKRS